MPLLAKNIRRLKNKHSYYIKKIYKQNTHQKSTGSWMLKILLPMGHELEFTIESEEDYDYLDSMLDELLIIEIKEKIKDELNELIET